MKVIDFVLILFLVLIIGAAVAYVVKAKKNGAKCIGCSAGGSCSHGNGESAGCGCGCGGTVEEESTCSCGCHADTNE